MFFRKQEKKKLNPWCVIIVGGLAAVGAFSIFNAGKEFIEEKGCEIKSFFKRKMKSGSAHSSDVCECEGLN